MKKILQIITMILALVMICSVPLAPVVSAVSVGQTVSNVISFESTQNSVDGLDEVEFTFFIQEEGLTRSSVLTHEVTITLSKVDNDRFKIAAYQIPLTGHTHSVTLSFDVKVFSKVPKLEGAFRFSFYDLSSTGYAQSDTFYYPNWGAAQISNANASGGGCTLTFGPGIIIIGS